MIALQVLCALGLALSAWLVFIVAFALMSKWRP